MGNKKPVIDRIVRSNLKSNPMAETSIWKYSVSSLICLFVVIAGLLVPLLEAAPQQRPQPNGLEWAYNVPDKNAPAPQETPDLKHVPGSSKAYTDAQANNIFDPPDWFPDEHAPMPQVVQKGSGKTVPACASCHLASGLGHPQSATLAGFPAAYLKSQLSAYKSGARKDPAMGPIGMNLSDEDAAQAAEWFAGLKPQVWVKVVEAGTVPKSYVDALFMRIPVPDGGTEPLGNRIITLPQETERALIRDPHSGFISYVPIGSIARGKVLVETGGAGKLACATCHGESLQGMGDIPRIAGLTPNYIVRQLYGMQTGTRAGAMAGLMKPVVEKMSQDDMLAIGAYLASLAP